MMNDTGYGGYGYYALFKIKYLIILDCFPCLVIAYFNNQTDITAITIDLHIYSSAQ